VLGGLFIPDPKLLLKLVFLLNEVFGLVTFLTDLAGLVVNLFL